MKLLVLSMLLLGATISYAGAASLGCDFSGDRKSSLPTDSQVAAQLMNDLTQYRLTSRQLPRVGKIYSVNVTDHTAVIDVDPFDPRLPGGMTTAVSQANDFRYAEHWQGFYDGFYHTNEACVRMTLMIRGYGPVTQWCWGRHGEVCTR